jgi:hypothetical protein
VPLLRQGVVDVVDRQVLFAQGDDPGAGRILLGLGPRPARGVREEVAESSVAEGVAQHPERPRSVAEAPGRLRRRPPFGEIGPQGFVLPVPWLLRLHEKLGGRR